MLLYVFSLKNRKLIMKYINKNTGDSISEEVFNQLSDSAKDNFIQAEDTVIKSHQIIETKSENMSIGDAVGLVAITPLIIFKSIF